MTFTDVDLTDRPVGSEATKSVTALQQDGITALTLTTGQQADIEAAFSISDAAGNTNDGTVNWDYTISEAELDFLGAGEVVTAVFTITVTDDEDATDTQDVTITITGSNDAPIVNGDDTDVVSGTIIEGLVDLTETGSVTFTDVDLTDRPVGSEATKSVTALQQDGSTVLTLTAGQQADIEAAFSISDAAGNTNDGTVNWDYTISEAELDFLGAGEVVTAVFTITVTDDEDATDTQDVTITVTGHNDGPVVTTATGQDAGSVIEAGNLDNGTVVPGTPSATGTVSSSDVDTAATATWSGNATGTYGSLVITAAGTWTYTLDNNDIDTQAIKEGATATDTFTTTVTDDKGATATETITITVTGTNDSPVVTTATGQDTGSVTEAGNLDNGTVVPGTPSATGTVSSSDVDTAATATWSGNATGTYGSLVITAAGVWTYTLNNNDVDTQAIKEGATATDTFTTTVTDDKGTTATETITITITGHNDAPIVTTATGQDAGSVTIGTPIATGTLASSDVDAAATATWSSDNTAAYNPPSCDSGLRRAAHRCVHVPSRRRF